MPHLDTASNVRDVLEALIHEDTYLLEDVRPTTATATAPPASR